MKSQFPINQFLNRILDKKDLNFQESQILMEEILIGGLTSIQIAGVLTALRMKGETVEEILGFISVMRKHMTTIKTDGVIVDTCGTGGDGSMSFNISTAAALTVAACGIKVAKHGNRSASSRCGSADVLEALGVNINLTPEQARKMLKETNFVFLFAPLYHQAMKSIAQVRRELGVRTVFNFLGPFVSPARVKRQIVGVPNREIAEKLALVAKLLDYEHLLIVTSLDGLDEISISSKTHVFEIKNMSIKRYSIDPGDFGLKGKKEGLTGGDKERNAQIIREIFDGKKGAKRDAVVINAAAALYVSGAVRSIKEGLVKAKDVIDSGHAKQLLHKVIAYE